VQGRIWFPGNPWPDGHRVTEFAWNGRLDGSGRLWFDLSLSTAFYYEDDDPAVDDDEPDEDEDGDDFGSRIVWGNYHACSISSVTWEDATGLVASTPERPFRFADPGAQVLTADPLPIEDLDAEPAFHIYLLGHDSVADHRVEFVRGAAGDFQVGWDGRIALSYSGDEEFRYAFRARIGDVRLGHVVLPSEMPLSEARGHLARLVDVPEWFVPAEVDGRRVLTLVDGLS